jgi:Mg/Co/Ni transporter MgtE
MINVSTDCDMSDEQKELLEQIEHVFESEDVSALRELLSDQRSSDIAEVVELVDNERKRAIFDAMDRPISAEVLEKVDEATRAELFELLKDEELGKKASSFSRGCRRRSRWKLRN